MFYVYIIYSKNDDRFYVGMTANIQQRIKDHNSGRNKSTKPYRPWIVVHTEVFQNRTDARKREKYLKTSAGRKWRKMNINIDDYLLDNNVS